MDNRHHNNVKSVSNVPLLECSIAGNWESLHGGNSLGPVIHSVTTPGTEQSIGAGKAVHSSMAKGESQRVPPQPLSSAQRGDSPIIQEPEEPQPHRESLSPRRSSLMIVESTEEQTENSARGYEEESLEKVNAQLFLNAIDTIDQFLCLAHFLR